MSRRESNARYAVAAGNGGLAPDPRRNPARAFWSLRALIGCSILLLSGCSASGPTPAQTPSPAGDAAVWSEVTRGPVRVTVEARPATVRLSDEPTLTLTLDYEIGVEVEKPPFGEAVGDFLVRDFRESLPEVQGQREIVRQTYRLEPRLTGPAQIDPIVVHFRDSRASGDGRRHQVETEALTVQVLSSVGANGPTLADLQGFEEPMAIPTPRADWVWWVVGVTVSVVACGGAWIAYRRLRTPPAIVRSPRELALQELDALWRGDSARRDTKAFYVELTGIVRRYIERTTGIHAPEQTTEEFLRELGGSDVFSRDRAQRLQEFLESSDLVKFAAYHPPFDDIQESYRRAVTFVESPPGEVAT